MTTVADQDGDRGAQTSMSGTSQEPRRPRAAGWHLLWAEPIGLAGAAAFVVLATFWRCGFSECHGDGRGSAGPTALLTALAAVAAAAPVVLVPWTALRLRLLVGAGVVAVAGGVAAAAVFTL